MKVMGKQLSLSHQLMAAFMEAYQDTRFATWDFADLRSSEMPGGEPRPGFLVLNTGFTYLNLSIEQVERFPVEKWPGNPDVLFVHTHKLNPYGQTLHLLITDDTRDIAETAFDLIIGIFRQFILKFHRPGAEYVESLPPKDRADVLAAMAELVEANKEKIGGGNAV